MKEKMSFCTKCNSDKITPLAAVVRAVYEAYLVAKSKAGK